MRNTGFFVAGFGLILLQANLYRLTEWLHVLFARSPLYAGAHWLHVTSFIPSLLLPLIVFMGVHEYSLARGAGIVFVLGYVADLVGVAPVGLFTFASVAMFVLARAAGVRLAAQTAAMQVVLAVAFAALQSVLVLVLLAIFGKDPYVPRALVPLVLPHVIATGLGAPLVFRLAQRVHQATARAAQGAAP
jgi:rod shape-determining protein MreD